MLPKKNFGQPLKFYSPNSNTEVNEEEKISEIEKKMLGKRKKSNPKKNESPEKDETLEYVLENTDDLIDVLPVDLQDNQ